LRIGDCGLKSKELEVRTKEEIETCLSFYLWNSEFLILDSYSMFYALFLLTSDSWIL